MDNYGVQNGVQNGDQLEKPLSLGEWIITLIVVAIPCVGFIMMFVWGFGKGGNTSRRNYCRAALILTAIVYVLLIIFYASLAAVLADALSSYSY